MVVECSFQRAGLVLTCTKCRFSISGVVEPVHRKCDSPSSLSPSLAQKAVNFAAAAAKHVAAGAPMASDEEVARRYAICQGCEHYDGKACAKCGCPVNRERAYLSKLSWADQSCPVGKWGPAENG